MASGLVHKRVSVCASIPVGLLFGWIFQNVWAGIIVFSGCLSGISISPDLDQETKTISEQQMIRDFGFIGRLWFYFWYPYAVIFIHRDVSHAPFLGTLTRIGYLGIPLLTIHCAFGGTVYTVPILVWKVVGLWAIGLAISDILHWVWDGCPRIIRKRVW